MKTTGLAGWRVRVTGLTAGFAVWLAVGGMTVAFGDSSIWKTTSGDWSTAGNWDGGVPAVNDDVYITNANAEVYLNSSTPYLKSLTIGNETAALVCSNWTTTISATSITVEANGTITCAGPFTTNAPAMSNRVDIVCSNLTVEQNGAIDVDGKGYAGGLGAGSTDGYGPGHGVYNAYGVGAGDGGRGGGSVNFYSWNAYPGQQPYGSITQPLAPGSGGGGSAGSGSGLPDPDDGGAGGGAVRITAEGEVTVDGAVTADGVSADGAGSGGSIYIECNTFDGTGGELTAKGGSGYPEHYGGGHSGGGRIAVKYDTAAQSVVPDVAMDVSPGALTGHYGPSPTRGDFGTIWFPDNRFVTEVISDNILNISTCANRHAAKRE